MKKVLVFVLLAALLVTPSALAGDVSGFEAHATIDLTPFKTERYNVAFDEYNYTAKIGVADSDWLVFSYTDFATSFKPFVYIRFDDGTPKYEIWMNSKGFSISSSYGSIKYNMGIRIGENRYYVTLYQGSDFLVDGPLFNILEEIAQTDKPVQIWRSFSRVDAVREKDIYTLTAHDIASIRTFVEDMKASGLDKYMPASGNVYTITKFN
ncbi:MAG: hypothetical protein IJK28_02365 [Clostridia bacterium]|nr:hypothetical protein [Clostridia bacterium]